MNARRRPAKNTPSLIEMLRELMKHPMAQKLALDVDYRDARSVSWRLSDLLPLEPEIKQGSAADEPAARTAG